MKSKLVVLLLVAVFLFSGCIQQPENEKIKIGFIGPFTGYSAQFGDMMQNGLDFALKELPEETRNKIEIIKEDDMCNSKEALTAARKLIDIDQVKYVIGPLCNEATLSTEGLFEDNNVISITIGLPSNEIANMGSHHFSFSPEIEYLMETIAEKIIENGIKEVAVIHMNAPFESENYKHFVKHFEEKGGVIVADEAIVRGSTDFRTPVQKVKEVNPEALMLVAHTGELINILKQLKELGLNELPKFGIHAAEAPSVIREAADVAEDLIYPYPADKTEIESAREYAGKYKKMYNFDPDPYSSNVYDSLNILVKSIDQCGYENTACVQQKLASVKDYAGANGLLSVDERGVGTYKEIMLKTVKNGEFVSFEGG